MPLPGIATSPDQAHGLRSLASRNGPAASAGSLAADAPDTNSHVLVRRRTTARVIAITSGKGGVGKTNIAVNLAHRLATSGHSVALLDADLGLANAHLLLGMTPAAH